MELTQEEKDVVSEQFESFALTTADTLLAGSEITERAVAEKKAAIKAYVHDVLTP